MKIRSTLPEQPFFVHVAALLNLIVILVMITMSTNKVDITRGLEIQLPLSPYVLPSARNMATVMVTGGEQPVYFLNDQRYENLAQLESGLDKLQTDMKLDSSQDKLFIVLKIDASVTAGRQMDLVNLIMSKGLNCGLAANPIR